jgi:hypothetical protein
MDKDDPFLGKNKNIRILFRTLYTIVVAVGSEEHAHT